MKSWTIRRVQQVGPTCTIACMAMIRGVPFAEVEGQFFAPEDGRLTKISDYLGDYGYSIIIKEIQYHMLPHFGREELTKPFAPAHVLHVKQYADDTAWHVIVMDRGGKLFDPAREKTSLDKFYMVTGVLGIWRPEDL